MYTLPDLILHYSLWAWTMNIVVDISVPIYAKLLHGKRKYQSTDNIKKGIKIDKNE